MTKRSLGRQQNGRSKSAIIQAMLHLGFSRKDISKIFEEPFNGGYIAGASVPKWNERDENQQKIAIEEAKKKYMAYIRQRKNEHLWEIQELKDKLTRWE